MESSQPDIYTPCGAQLRNKPGRYCQRRPAEGRTRCKLHGGATPRGLASPHTKTGYMSSHLPTRLMARMAEMLDDGALHSLNRDIAFVSARIDDVLARLSSEGEAQSTWRKLLSLREEALNARTKEESGEAIQRMFEVLAHVERELNLYDEVHELIDQRAKLIKAETDKQVKLSQGVTLDQVALYFRALSMAVRENVDDETLARIYTAFDQINTRNSRLRLAPMGG